jgi:hypothetical protein
MRRALFSLLMALAYATVPAAVLPDVAVPPAAAAEVSASVVAQEPAVSIPEDAETEEEQPWTARYLIPTLMVMGLVVLVAVLIAYGVRLRGRYRVVQ